MRGRASLLLVMVAATELASCEASADQLCGRSFGSFDQLYAELDGEPTHQLRGSSGGDVTYIDSRGTYWKLTQPTHAVAPAAACFRRVSVAQRIELQCQFWCRALRDCDTFIDGFKKEIRIRDFDALSCEWK